MYTSKHMQNKSTVWYLVKPCCNKLEGVVFSFLPGSLALFMAPQMWYIMNQVNVQSIFNDVFDQVAITPVKYRIFRDFSG